MNIKIFLCLIVLCFAQFSTSCSKSPSDPSDFGEAVLKTFAEEDYEAFLEMTVMTLTQSQFEGAFETMGEKKLSHLESKLEDATKEEKDEINEEIDEIKKDLDDSDTLEIEAMGAFMKMGSEDFEFEEWKEKMEEINEYRIQKLEEDIKDDPKKDEGEDYRKERLKNMKSESFSRENFGEWKSRKKRNNEKWEESFNSIIKEAKNAGINWEDASFEFVDYDKERITHDNTDIMLVFSYREKSFKIELDDCLQTNLGIIMGDQPIWKGPFVSE